MNPAATLIWRFSNKVFILNSNVMFYHNFWGRSTTLPCFLCWENPRKMEVCVTNDNPVDRFQGKFFPL